MSKGTPEQYDKPFHGYQVPDVYLEDTYQLPRHEEFLTGVPAFLGVVPKPSKLIREAKKLQSHMLSLWAHFFSFIGEPTNDCWLAYAVRGFFENGGERCYVVVLRDRSAASLEDGLQVIAHQHTIDLVCAPDLVKDREKAFDLQQQLVDHCETTGDRFAILDSRLGDSNEHLWQQWSAINGSNGAIYCPWVKVHPLDDSHDGRSVTVPPCGYVAGVYSRTDYGRGVHKAPANEVLQGVLGLERHLTDEDQAFLNPKRVNCIRSFPGRGIRVWGARTLSNDNNWMYVNVRRLFLTAIRWIEWHMKGVVFEPNDTRLWSEIERELTGYFLEVYQSGALQGATPQAAFYVKCDAETNPPELRELGQVVTEIGLAPAVPYEFIVVRLIHGASGVSISGPLRPEQTYKKKRN